MKKLMTITLILGSIFLMGQAYGSSDTAKMSAVNTEAQATTFNIENMTCKMCPITVRKAMGKIDGVIKVTTNFDAKTATAIFDPSKTNVKLIGEASTNAGYPATAVN